MNRQIILKNIAPRLVYIVGFSLVILLALGSVSCDRNSVDNNSGSNYVSKFTKHQQLIENSADIMYAGYGQLATATITLKSSIYEYCANTTSIASSTKRQAAQNAFKAAMPVLQHSLSHSAKEQGLGPALDGERGIEVVYSWPLTSSCNIDFKLAENNANPGHAINRRGMDALEYLLFVDPNSNHTCDSTEIQLETFNALSEAVKQLRRCNYMKAVIADVVITTNKIKERWDPADGDFLGTMKNSHLDVLVTLNNIADAMYYLADVGKEDKLDQPMGGGRTGTTPSCGTDAVCPADVESPNAKISLDNLIANTVSFQELYYGGSPANKATNVGFDDWLIAEEGNNTLAEKLGTDITTVLSDLNLLKTHCTSLYMATSTVTSDCFTRLEEFYDGPFQNMTQSWRDDVLPILKLQPPQGSLNDAD